MLLSDDVVNENGEKKGKFKVFIDGEFDTAITLWKPSESALKCKK
jgi:hypothetical protein